MCVCLWLCVCDNTCISLHFCVIHCPPTPHQPLPPSPSSPPTPQAQFLDPSHLLIAMGKAQNWLHRSTTTDALSSNSGIMLYNWTTGQVVDYFPAGTHDTSVLGELCTRAPVGEQVGSMWQRCIAPKMSVHSGVCACGCVGCGWVCIAPKMSVHSGVCECVHNVVHPLHQPTSHTHTA